MTTPALEKFDGAERPPIRALRFRIRTLALWIVAVAVGLGLALDPVSGPLVLGAIGALCLGVGALLAAMVLGALGLGLFAAVTRAAAWIRRGARWPDDAGP